MAFDYIIDCSASILQSDLRRVFLKCDWFYIYDNSYICTSQIEQSAIGEALISELLIYPYYICDFIVCRICNVFCFFDSLSSCL